MKLDGDTGQFWRELACVYGIYRNAGQAVFDGVTDERNNHISSNRPGTFSISEVTAPGGYMATGQQL